MRRLPVAAAVLCLGLSGCFFLAPPRGAVRTIERQYSEQPIPHTGLSMSFFGRLPFDEGMPCQAPWVWRFARPLAWESGGFEAGFQAKVTVLIELADMDLPEYREYRRRFVPSGDFQIADVSADTEFTEHVDLGGSRRMRVRAYVTEPSDGQILVLQVRLLLLSDGTPPPEEIQAYAEQVFRDLSSSIRRIEAPSE